jgi:propanediol dehydratase large subunit
MNENLRRAVEALESGANEARRLSAGSAFHVRNRVKRAVEEALDHLEADADTAEEPESVMDALDRQSREIAEDLRRAERLMKRRTGQG